MYRDGVYIFNCNPDAQWEGQVPWKREKEIEDDVAIDDGPWVARGATFSPCRRYRYRLWAAWDETKPRCVFLMLNPASADEVKLDRTVRRCVVFARDWGFGSLDVINIFAWRDSDPRNLPLKTLETGHTDCEPAIGPDNDAHIIETLRGAGAVVLAWSGYGMLLDRGVPRGWRMEALVAQHAPPGSVHILGMTGDGQTRHPLYMKKSTKLIPWYVPPHPTMCRYPGCTKQARVWTESRGRKAPLWSRLEGGRIACDEHGSKPEPLKLKSRQKIQLEKLMRGKDEG